MNINNQNPYFKINKIRTKLLLFIDNEIQSKIKQNIKNLKFNCAEETPTRIIFEETFTHKRTHKYSFSFSNIGETKKINNSCRFFSTVRGSSIVDEYNHSIKQSNNSICLHKKIHTIKNRSKHSSAFLTIPKRKNASEYLKSLCNKLKIRKKDKKPNKHNRSSVIKRKLLDLSKDKKSRKISNEIKLEKSNKNNQYTYSLFRKPQKANND